ncbi:hypothetical protein [Enterococcus caccae]|uniref:DUF5626 domain-containing protein n=1 Tax=Enterococcus caccae ATCC BAA-1240 TaxID=1158612 RepID=R3WEF3_9ENTE|nr:hypothetical protein [Enterococcus caccae]EOL45837.1 hypothetical protein UC7_01634 [Enterococcus caccae ATCC BAA-1240]EOT61033.1 hypothetical protein I580_01935 [Enterococcus caccae ATCC BAA-1240]OJG27937.1 hypothetical protein RU98_GL002146 [Enterococcus caccae]
MKKKFAVIITLIFGVLSLSGTSGYAKEDVTTQRFSFQPYFASVSNSKLIKSFESADFLILKLPVISGYHVNYHFKIRTSALYNENFLVKHVSPDGQCVLSEEVVAGNFSKGFFGSTAGSSDYGTDYLVARVTNLAPTPVGYTIDYNYKLSKDPTDFVGL